MKIVFIITRKTEMDPDYLTDQGKWRADHKLAHNFNSYPDAQKELEAINEDYTGIEKVWRKE